MHDLMGGSEQAYQEALNIALQAEVIQRCEVCGDDVCVKELDPEAAYRLGSAKFKKGELQSFGSQKEVTDEIESVFNDAYDGTPGLCSRCDHKLNSD